MRRGSQRKSSNLSHIKILVLPIAILVIGGFIMTRRGSDVVSPVPKDNPETTHAASVLLQKKKNPDELHDLVQTIIGTTWKNYSVYVKGLSSNFEFGINDTVMYDAASVNKIPILAALYVNAESGKVDLNKQITVQTKDIQDYGTGTIRYEKPGGIYSLKTLARLMMQQSDNTAAYILSVYIVPTADIQKLLPSWGLTQTDMINNQTSNRDIAILLPKLLDGKIVNLALTQELKAFFKDTEFEDRLPSLLPKTATVYHKTGDAIATLHDVGIVEDGKLKYYIGIFTSDITDEEQTKKLMAKISRLVYDYLKQ
ncbi:MAG: serine hydrolase [Patescibacteria group bacterium]